MAESPDALKLRWGFLAPWCAHPKGRLQYEDMLFEQSAWVTTKHRLCVVFPTTYDTRSTFEEVREALALLAALAHVDLNALNFILYKEQRNVSGDDPVRLCGPEQEEDPSEGYIAALEQIVRLGKNPKLKGQGVEIDIPVRVEFAAGHEGHIMNKLSEIVAAEKDIQELWEDFYSENPGARAVESGKLRCKLVLQPMLGDISDAPIDPELVTLVGQAVEENVWFSRLVLYLQFAPEIVRGEWKARTMFGKLMRRLFDSTRRTIDLSNTDYHLQLDRDNLRQFGYLSVGCDDHELGSLEFEAICSAMVLAQTTTKLALSLEVHQHNQALSGHWWKWTAYALFSRRARANSAVTHLALEGIGRLSVEDAEIFTALLSSEHPEEELFSSPRGRVEERDAIIKERARMQWKFDEAGQSLRNSHPLVCVSPIEHVRTFSDDGESEWVNVLVPGYGRCQVQRSDIIFDCDSSPDVVTSEITSLSIQFSFEPAIGDGLPQLMAVIGGPLTSLSLRGRRDVLGDDLFLGCCPNLLELSLQGSVVEAQLNFRGYRKHNNELPSIICNWHDVVPLSAALMVAYSPLVKCMHRLRIRLAYRYHVRTLPQGYDPANYRSDLEALLEMLEVNRSLEYVEVVVPTMHEAYITKFAKHQNKQIERARQLALETKLAFLSVVDCCKSLRPTKERKRGDALASTSAMCKLDHLILSNIFALTAPPVFRQVICRSVSEFGVDNAAGAGGDHDSDEEENNLEEEQSDEGEQSGESEEETQGDESDEEAQDHESDANEDT